MVMEGKENPVVTVARVSAAAKSAQENVYRPLSLDQASRLRVLLKGAVEDGLIPADALQALMTLPVTAFAELFNDAAGTWDRAQSTPDSANGIAPGSAGLAGVVARGLAYNGTDRKSTRLNSSHIPLSRMPSSA